MATPLVISVQNLATRISTECKSIRTLINGNAADLSSLTTSNKTSVVAALNELKTLVGQAAVILDSATDATHTWSASKIQTQITAGIASVVAGAPAALDTLIEIANQLTSDEGVTASLLTAVGNRLRFDAAQGLTAAQLAQGQANLNVLDASAIGDLSANFVTVFQNGLT